MESIVKFVVLAAIAGAAVKAADKAGAKLGIPAIAVPTIAGALYACARKLR
jgi:hypothetical protein